MTMDTFAPPAAAEPAGRRRLERAARFLTGGAAVLPFSFSFYVVAVHAGMRTTPARALAFAGGTAAVYVIHRRWSFRARGGIAVGAGFALLYLTTFAVALAVNAAVLAVLPASPWAVPAGWLASQSAATALNFCGLHCAVFRGPAPDDVPHHRSESRN